MYTRRIKTNIEKTYNILDTAQRMKNNKRLKHNLLNKSTRFVNAK